MTDAAAAIEAAERLHLSGEIRSAASELFDALRNAEEPFVILDDTFAGHVVRLLDRAAPLIEGTAP